MILYAPALMYVNPFCLALGISFMAISFKKRNKRKLILNILRLRAKADQKVYL